MFLLKGHEDLRQDERVMQLFGLVNTLLTNDPETFKRHLRWVGLIHLFNFYNRDAKDTKLLATLYLFVNY